MPMMIWVFIGIYVLTAVVAIAGYIYLDSIEKAKGKSGGSN